MKQTPVSQAEFQAAREATGPAPVPLWQILRRRRVDPLERWSRIRAEHGPVARYRFGLSDSYLLSSAEAVQRVLQDNPGGYSKHHPTYAMLRRVFGNGLLTSEGDFWLRQRRLAQPAFHRPRLQRMGEAMAAAAQEAAARWDEAASRGEPVTMLREMSRVTLKVVGDALFGAALRADSAAMAGAWDVLNAQLSERHAQMRLLPPVLPTAYDRTFRHARRTLLGVVERIITERRGRGAGGGDLLTILMEARDEDTGESMTDGQLRDEVVTILLAGHETTATALAWTWVLLDHHPAAAAALRAELDRVLQGRPPAAADLPQLPYARAVIDEAMRLQPPAYILNRRVEADDVVCGFRVHRGGSIVISPLVLHRHPAYWKQPDAFVPERWDGEAAEERRPKFAYLPFSGGPRQCIGNHFALMEATLILTTLAQRFEVRCVDGYVPKPEYLVLCRPSEGAPMRLERRRARATRVEEAAPA
ncbi:MAG TPA: cytochrome P450 [Steroidobacteraceae bacterium]|nr:cytochrome P450 [Steroidobacteraceae bacterium]